jgi:hypothetical protein
MKTKEMLGQPWARSLLCSGRFLDLHGLRRKRDGEHRIRVRLLQLLLEFLEDSVPPRNILAKPFLAVAGYAGKSEKYAGRRDAIINNLPTSTRAGVDNDEPKTQTFSGLFAETERGETKFPRLRLNRAPAIAVALAGQIRFNVCGKLF